MFLLASVLAQGLMTAAPAVPPHEKEELYSTYTGLVLVSHACEPYGVKMSEEAVKLMSEDLVAVGWRPEQADMSGLLEFGVGENDIKEFGYFLADVAREHSRSFATQICEMSYRESAITLEHLRSSAGLD